MYHNRPGREQQAIAFGRSPTGSLLFWAARPRNSAVCRHPPRGVNEKYRYVENIHGRSDIIDKPSMARVIRKGKCDVRPLGEVLLSELRDAVQTNRDVGPDLVWSESLAETGRRNLRAGGTFSFYK